MCDTIRQFVAPVFAVTWALAGALPARGQELLAVVNDTRGFMSLWVLKTELNAWDNPPLSLFRGETKFLSLTTPGPYYLVARDDSGRDFHIGSFDLHEKVRQYPKLELSLRTAYETRQRMVRRFNPAKGIYEEVPETETVGKDIFSWRLSDAKKERSEDVLSGEGTISPTPGVQPSSCGPIMASCICLPRCCGCRPLFFRCRR